MLLSMGDTIIRQPAPPALVACLCWLAGLGLGLWLGLGIGVTIRVESRLPLLVFLGLLPQLMHDALLTS